MTTTAESPAKRGSGSGRRTGRAGKTSRAPRRTATQLAADDVGQYLRATASYEDDRGSGKEASAAVTGRIEDSTDRPTSNNAPTFSQATTTRSIGQGTGAGRNVGAPVRATDEDTGDVLTYSLDGTDALLFDIDPATGQVLTRVVLDYDPDGTNSYSVDVRVHDGYGPDYQSTDVGVDATVTVTITVTQARRAAFGGIGGGGGIGGIGGGGGSGGGGSGGGGGAPPNRSPSFAEGDAATRSVAENTAAGQDVGAPVAAGDLDGDTLAYTLGGADAQFFDLQPATGQLRVKALLDYETRSSYTVVVRVADGRGAEDSIAVTVVVVNVGLEGKVGGYDKDDNGAIDRNEAVAAVVDYFDGAISKEEAIAVVTVYFAG